MVTFKEWLKNKNEVADPFSFNKELAGVVNAANNPVQNTTQVQKDPSTMAKTIYNNANPQLKKAFQDIIMKNMQTTMKTQTQQPQNPNTMPVTTTGMSQPSTPTIGGGYY